MTERVRGRRAGADVTTFEGLLIADVILEVPGLRVDNPVTAPWCRLGPEDYRQRRAEIVALVLHTTKGIHPQRVVAGAGPSGDGRRVADYWRVSAEGRGRSSAAPIVIGRDGAVACLADVVRVAAHHATTANPYTIGIELYQEADGDLYEAQLEACTAVTRTLCRVLEIPWQIVGDPYRGAPIARVAHDGRSVYGVYGHRDQTHERGRGDPGDAVYAAHVAAGCESLRFGHGADLVVWERRQRALNVMDLALGTGRKPLLVDGLPGPSTMRRLAEHGFAAGRDLDGAAEAQ